MRCFRYTSAPVVRALTRLVPLAWMVFWVLPLAAQTDSTQAATRGDIRARPPAAIPATNGAVPSIVRAPPHQAVLRRGQRLRVFRTATGGPIEGRVHRYDGDALTLRSRPDREPIRFRVAELHRVEVGRGRGIGPALFAVGGAIAGGFLGLQIAHSARNCSEDPESVLTCVLDPAPTFGGFALGMLGGGALGLLIGRAVTPERWEPVPLRGLALSLAPDARRGIALSISHRF